MSKSKNCKKLKRKTQKKWMGGKPLPNVTLHKSSIKPSISKYTIFKPPTASYVKQSQFKIVDATPNKIDLFTYGLATCTGLSMVIKNKKFMAHLNPSIEQNSIDQMVFAIKKEISNQNIDVNTLFPTIYAGALQSDRTVQIAKEICNNLNIPEENCKILNVCFMREVGI